MGKLIIFYFDGTANDPDCRGKNHGQARNARVGSTTLFDGHSPAMGFIPTAALLAALAAGAATIWTS